MVATQARQISLGTPVPAIATMSGVAKEEMIRDGKATCPAKKRYMRAVLTPT